MQLKNTYRVIRYFVCLIKNNVLLEREIMSDHMVGLVFLFIDVLGISSGYKLEQRYDRRNELVIYKCTVVFISETYMYN